MDGLLNWQHYHRLNIDLLSMIGLWPYGNKFVLRLKRFISSFFVLLYCFSEIASFFTVNYTKTLLLSNVSYIFVACAVFVKYVSYLCAGDCIKKNLEGINNDWQALSSEEEIRIIKKYVERGKFHTKGFAMFACPATLCLVLQPWLSVLFEIVMPPNQTRGRSLPFMFEILIDQKKHFFLIAFLFDGVIIVAAFVFVSTEALLIVYSQHACALFEVTSCRIKKLLCASTVRYSKNSSNLVIIADVVSVHCRAIRYCKSLKEDLLPSYLILLVFGILSLSAYILRCTQTFASREFAECLTSMMFCFAILGYMFYINFILQNVQDTSGDIFNNWYNTVWYNVPITTRKLIFFCMLNCIKPVSIDSCHLFVPCYETFSIIIKMTMSYTTALFSFQ